ncbi:hypothetical protein SLEP1_g11897 [Rubroshorea leprosula]|nr:hypothetical protein SLEP1_g11897 [Rubroshorea leprosula]
MGKEDTTNWSKKGSSSSTGDQVPPLLSQSFMKYLRRFQVKWYLKNPHAQEAIASTCMNHQPTCILNVIDFGRVLTT